MYYSGGKNEVLIFLTLSSYSDCRKHVLFSSQAWYGNPLENLLKEHGLCWTLESRGERLHFEQGRWRVSF